MKNMSLILLFLSLLFPSCSDDKSAPEVEPQPPVVVNPPVESLTIKGSFESKYKRYAQKDKHEGQVSPSKVSVQWCDTVWRNDRAHKQIVLWTEKDVKGLTYQVNDLHNGKQTIPSSNIRLRFPTYVLGDMKALDCGMQTSRQSAYIADALSEQPVTYITTSNPTKIWVTVDIPKDTAPGLYEGTIDVKQTGEEAKLSFDIKLLVTAHTLPDVKDWSFHLDIWQFPFQLTNLCNNSGTQIMPFSAEYETLMSSFYKMLADAGQKSITTYIKDGAFLEGETMIGWILNSDNTWSFDYTNFDKFVTFMSDLGINKQINCFSLVGWNSSVGYYDVQTSGYKTKKLNIGSDEYNKIWTAFLTSFRVHLVSKGWFDKAVLFLDEAPYDETKQVINLIRENGTDWKIGLAGSRNMPDVEQELYDYSTIYGYDRTTDNPVSTFYTSCSQTIPNNYVSKETSPAEMVWMAWYAAAKGFDGYLRWAFDYWQSADPLNIQDGTNTAGDFNMIYRTDNKVTGKAVASIRFELLREGIQDYEKVKILNNAKLNAVVKSIDDNSALSAEKTMVHAQKILKEVSVN